MNGLVEGGGGGAGIQKPIKKCHEINIISALTRPNNSLKKAMKLGGFLLSWNMFNKIATIVYSLYFEKQTLEVLLHLSFKAELLTNGL